MVGIYESQSRYRYPAHSMTKTMIGEAENENL